MQTTENVYGVNVNKGMGKVAKTLLNLHMLFVVMYFITGVLQIAGGLFATKPQFHQEGSLNVQQDPMQELFSGMLSIVISMGMFFVVRMAIQKDSRDMIKGAMLCDGCCACCHCCIGFMFVLAFASLSAGKSYLTTDLCVCQSTPKPLCDEHDACSSCFNAQGCRDGIQQFHETFPLMHSMVLILAVCSCAEMACCALAAHTLNRASIEMIQTPFCRTAPQVNGSTVVGVPVQGTVLGVAKPAV